MTDQSGPVKAVSPLVTSAQSILVDYSEMSPDLKKFLDAASSADLKERIKAARVASEVYLLLNSHLNHLTTMKERVKAFCVGVLETMKRRDLTYDGVKYQKAFASTVTYDLKKLIPILRKHKLEKKVLKIVVDSEALTEEVKAGNIPLDELKPAVQVKDTFSFRVDRVTVKKETDA